MLHDATPDVISQLDKVADDHLGWIRQVNCALIFRAPAPPPFVIPAAAEEWARANVNPREATRRQAALARLRRSGERMQREADELCAKAAAVPGFGPEHYMSFMTLAQGFQRQLRQLATRARQCVAETDPLTGLHNRQGMLRDLHREWTRAQRTGQPCCIALIDLDHFKRVNDTYGHLAGDRVLAAAARLIQRRLRPYDLVYRFGGEEFLICLPETEAADACRVLDRIRNLIARFPVSLGAGRKTAVTASIGLAEMLPEETPEQAIDRADQAVYQAKARGRNRLCLDSIDCCELGDAALVELAARASRSGGSPDHLVGLPG